MFNRKENRRKYYQEHKEQEKEKVRKYRKEYPEKVKKSKKKCREKHYEEYKKKERENSKKYRQENPDKVRESKRKPKIKFSKYKQGAKERSLNFDLTFEQFMTFWQKPCYYCGDKIETIGIDRIDNSKGYEINNIVSCCKMCNRMKMAYSLDNFLRQCKKIIEKSLENNEKIT